MTRPQLTDDQITARFLNSKPGRKPLPDAPAVPDTLNPVAVAHDLAAADQLIELQAGYAEGRDLANQLLGQVQMADSLSKFTMTVSVSKLAYVKEHKLYKALKGKKTADGQQFSGAFPIESADKSADGQQFSGTWEEYCALLGRSHQQVDEEIRNLKTFGEAALESMSAMGIGYRELRQYRRLPADQQQALIEVARLGDKEGFVELAEEIIAKHAKEKERASEDLETKDVVLKKANERINALEFELARKFKPNAHSVAQDEAEQALVNELGDATLAAHTATRRLFKAADKALDGTAREAIELHARQQVEYLCQQLVDISAQFGISVDFETRLQPAWMSEDMLAAMEARNAALDAEQAAALAAKKAKPAGKPRLALAPATDTLPATPAR